MLKRFSLIASVFLVMVFAMVGALSAPASAANHYMPLLIDFDVDDAHSAPDQAERYDFILTGHEGRLMLAPDIVPAPKQTFDTLTRQDVLLLPGGDAFRVSRG